MNLPKLPRDLIPTALRKSRDMTVMEHATIEFAKTLLAYHRPEQLTEGIEEAIVATAVDLAGRACAALDNQAYYAHELRRAESVAEA